MLPRIDYGTFAFGEPVLLWLLVIPGALLAMWVRQFWRRRLEAKRSARGRVLAAEERHPLAGDLAFWACGLIAASLAIASLARPQVKMSVVRRGAADIVILLDGSASMYTRDVAPDRWQRSVRFLRAFADALGWKGDRVALAIFAHLASPQVRLTKDPNALFFFLDHLGEHSPFRLEDDTTWDTNIEEGLYWGLKLVEKDEEIFGKSTNAKAFVVISDGQAWSGHVRNALATARSRRVPVYVVGVGTTLGGVIPDPGGSVNQAVLDRDSLREIARAGGGEYFEIGTESDREVAFRIVQSVRRRAVVSGTVDSVEELYWRFLAAAAIVLGLGTLVVKEATELWWQSAALAGTLLILSNAR